MIPALILIIILMLFILLVLVYNNKKLHITIKQKEELYSNLLGQKKSSEVRLGQISENLAPFLKDFKYNPKKAHFIGMPIDYIIFEDNKIVFLEVKSGKSQLTPNQRNIKKLIDSKKIFWDMMRIN